MEDISFFLNPSTLLYMYYAYLPYYTYIIHIYQYYTYIIHIYKIHRFCTPGLLSLGAAAVVGDSRLLLFLLFVLLQNLHSSNLFLAFTTSFLIFRIAFTDDPCVAFTDSCIAFTDPLHSICSKSSALTQVGGSVELFEAFISFLPRSQLCSSGTCLKLQQK